MLVLRVVQREFGLLVADNEISVGFLKRSQPHLPRHTRFVLPRKLRYRIEDTLGEVKESQSLKSGVLDCTGSFEDYATFLRRTWPEGK